MNENILISGAEIFKLISNCKIVFQPKARPIANVPFRSGSLPCQSPPKTWRTASDSLDDGRTVLGIGISAVHDAVLRGIARVPGNFNRL